MKDKTKEKDKAKDYLARMESTIEKLLSNVPTPEIVAATQEDFILLAEYSHVVDLMWAITEQLPNHMPINKQQDILAMLIATYTMGYRKGRAATPLTLVVAPDQEGL